MCDLDACFDAAVSVAKLGCEVSTDLLVNGLLTYRQIPFEFGRVRDAAPTL